MWIVGYCIYWFWLFQTLFSLFLFAVDQVYDRCITDLRIQLDRDVDTEGGPTTSSAVVAVRPVIRQPRALIRVDDPKSPTSSARSDCNETTKGDHESIKSVAWEFDEELSLNHSPRKVTAFVTAPSSASSSIATDIQGEADEFAAEQALPSVVDTSANESGAANAAAETEKSLSELSTDPSSVQDIVEPHDSGRADLFNQTMIIKSDLQVREEVAEEISRAIIDQLVEETITLATECLINKSNNNNRPCNSYSSRFRIEAQRTANWERMDWRWTTSCTVRDQGIGRSGGESR